MADPEPESRPPARRPRAVCPYCGRRKAVRKNGAMWAHYAVVEGRFKICGGSGQRAGVRP